MLGSRFQGDLVERTVPELAGQVDAYAGEVVTSLEKASGAWADGANAVVSGLNDDINKDVLGYVANATDTINSTITTFSNAMQKDLESVFGGTVLLDPIKTVIHCVIGIKIESLQKGLTWVHDHAHVEFPMLDKDVFSKGANDSIAGDADLTTFLSSPSSVGTDEVSGAVKHVTDRMRDSLVTETLISVAILLVYFIVVLMGIVRVLAGVASSLRWRPSPRRAAPDGHELAVHDGTASTERILPQERDGTEPVADLPLSTAKPPSITDDPPSYGSSMYGNAR
ncbi:hypothetical protein NQ176_g10540 [Zarea fungicola]|uniref:Uncharacterized protein n=1 Tax=Zarea fungicola TaxID=93591 RepID=A0ACC1MG21_9HYPO|nr:hypothetical protein NQ176_g10540 [Lecanicillium fungicola]